MPFPWKKNRVTRLSQIVADLQSPKRGGSLVVETGFPTSLIDLFVKNKSRFKKPKSKKPVRPEIPDPPPPSPATTPPSTLSDSPAPSPTIPHAEAPTLTQSVVENADAAAVSDRIEECGGAGSAVVGVFVKMFVVVGLIASVKSFTVGITVSAFALLFLEYAGKRVVSRLGPCSCANVKLESLSKRVSVSACVLFQKFLQLKWKTRSCEVAIAQGEILVGKAELSTGSLSIDEIEVVETKSEVGICREECYCSELKWSYSELMGNDDSSMGMTKVVEPCGISECKIKSSRSARFKSKMVKKLVPKKFLGGSKKGKNEKRSKEIEAESCSEVSSAVDEDKSRNFEIEEEAEPVAKEEEEGSNRSSLLLRTKLVCARDDEAGCGITCSQESQLAMEDVAVTVSDEKIIDGVGNSGYIILLVIALAGLALGRVPALILTVTWCFMVKMVNTVWRSHNVPLIKCSVPKS